MSFENSKKVALSKIDKSPKGSIDREIIPLLNLINSNPNYYTTSSCAGRICLLRVGKKGKRDSSWLFVSHDTTKFKDIKKALSKLPKDKVWFIEESMILHVCCRTIEDANRLLNIFKPNGFKHSGISSISKKMEVHSTQCSSREQNASTLNSGDATNCASARNVLCTYNKIIVEIMSTEHITALIANKGKLLVTDDYLKVLIKEANKMLQKTKEKIKKISKK